MDLRVEGDLLVVRAGVRIPKVCVKCGATKDVSRRDQAFAAGAQGASAGAAGGVVGVMVANVVRNAFRDEPGMQAAIIATVFVVVCIGAVIVQRVTPKVHLELPLCGQHRAQLDAALQHRTWLLLALGLAGVVLVFAIGVSNLWLMGLALVIMLGAIGAAFALAMPKAWIKAKWAKDDHVALDLEPGLATKILERAEKRAKQSQAPEESRGNDGAAEASPPA